MSTTSSTTLTLPAVRSVQGDLVLYSTSIPVRHLVRPNFYSVERLDPEDKSGTGYQRYLNTARAKKLMNYILKGQEENQDVFLPTSVLLATDKDLEYNDSTKTIVISEEIYPFSVVDGQHRLEGLRMASEKNDKIRDFPVLINIAVKLDNIAQMCHFLIVNTTQKSVDKSVEQRIYSRLTAAINVEDTPTLPKWIQRIVSRGEVDKAVKIADYLNSEKGSPWLGKIQMANQSSEKKHTTNQGSFVKLINNYVLVADNPLYSEKDFDFDKVKKVYLNYWQSIASLLDDKSPSVLYNYNGIRLFSNFSIPFFKKLEAKGQKFTVETMKQELKTCFDAMEGDYAGLGSSDWWHSGSQASGLNQQAIASAVKDMTKALHAGSKITL